jgi:hypothetical protein
MRETFLGLNLVLNIIEGLDFISYISYYTASSLSFELTAPWVESIINLACQVLTNLSSVICLH